MTAPSTTAGRIAFVGSGPGDPGLLTVRARDALAAATLVVTDPGVPEDVLGLLPSTTTVRPVGHADDPAAGGPATDAVVAPGFAADDPAATSGPAPGDPAKLAETVVAEARSGASVVRLVAGDPLVRRRRRQPRSAPSRRPACRSTSCRAARRHRGADLRGRRRSARRTPSADVRG